MALRCCHAALPVSQGRPFRRSAACVSMSRVCQGMLTPQSCCAEEDDTTKPVSLLLALLPANSPPSVRKAELGGLRLRCGNPLQGIYAAVQAIQPAPRQRRHVLQRRGVVQRHLVREVGYRVVVRVHLLAEVPMLACGRRFA